MTSTPNRGWTVALAGTGINLALGILYTWSMFKGAIEKEFGWSAAQLNDPYALCCLVFAFAMIVAGRSQDRLGPRLTASVGGVLVGAGLVLISLSSAYSVWLVGFGVLAGAGIGFGYSAATPPALKWFPPARTGVIAGVVVAGFGLAPVYLSPLSQFLLTHHGLRPSMLIYGLAFVVVVCGLAQLLRNPPSGYTPIAPGQAAAAKPAGPGMAPRQVLRSPGFYLLWTIYFIGAGAGLMVISSVSGMAKKSMGDAAFVAVAVMAIGNAAGRLGAGLLSDRIGRRMTLAIVLLCQAILMLIAIPTTRSAETAGVTVVLVATLIGFNYGANLSLFPAFAKDLWGLKHFGQNYGILFTAWGVGGFALSRLQQTLAATSGGSYTSSFLTASALLVVGALLTLSIKPAERPA